MTAFAAAVLSADSKIASAGKPAPSSSVSLLYWIANVIASSTIQPTTAE